MERIAEEDQEMIPDNNEPANVRQRIGLERLEIVLDNSQHVYYASKFISGRIFLDLHAPVDGLGLRFKCKGEAQVYFTNRSAGFRRRFAAEESYLHEVIHLKGDQDESSEIKIESGVYPFSLKLPEKLPCSFEGRYGRVRYSISATLVITKTCSVSSDLVPFTVAPDFDLNNDPFAPLPTSESIAKTFMGQNEPLSLSAFIPVRGYVPGQNIPLKITLKNPSHIQVKKLRIVLKKVVLYRSTDKVRKHKEIIVEIEQPTDRKIEEYNADVDVPALPPSGTICSLIDVRYTLKVEACVDVSEWYYRMFHKNLKIRTCVVIGTVPLSNYENPVELSSESLVTELSVADSNGHEEETNNDETLLKPNSEPTLKYQRSRVYRSSKPDHDDPPGDEGNSDGEVEPYSPMYRVYKFQGSK